jgi:hypothetical protein
MSEAQPYWAIATAVAWVTYRDVEKAEVAAKDATPFDVVNNAVRVGEDLALKAREELARALSEGKLVAYGRPVDNLDHPHEPIPKEKWKYIDTLFVINPAFSPHSLGSAYNKKPIYFDCFVNSADVISLWAAPPSSARAESDCRKFLNQKMGASPARRAATNKELWTEAKNLFRGLSERGFTRAKAEAIKECSAFAWGKAGAPKKIE